MSPPATRHRHRRRSARPALDGRKHPARVLRADGLRGQQEAGRPRATAALGHAQPPAHDDRAAALPRRAARRALGLVHPHRYDRQVERRGARPQPRRKAALLGDRLGGAGRSPDEAQRARVRRGRGRLLPRPSRRAGRGSERLPTPGQRAGLGRRSQLHPARQDHERRRPHIQRAGRRVQPARRPDPGVHRWRQPQPRARPRRQDLPDRKRRRHGDDPHDADLLVAKPALYISMDSSEPVTATLDEATLAPAIADVPVGGDDARSRRSSACSRSPTVPRAATTRSARGSAARSRTTWLRCR